MVEGTTPLALLAPPYTRLQPLAPSTSDIRACGRQPGSALIWIMGSGGDAARERAVRSRPGGVALLVILPPDRDIAKSATLALHLQQLRPHGILPYHPEPTTSDLSQVLRRPPVDLAGEVVDYLRWRGFALDRDTVHLLRRILDLSGELRSISSVSRSMYLSRRALGRRLTTRGLPVPSHWLQMGRLLRVAVRLQNTEATVSSVAFEHGYPDGFALSNQMERLIGHRPSEVRRRLGWEWLVESWLRREAETGRLTVTGMGAPHPGEAVRPPSLERPARPSRSRGAEPSAAGG